MRRLDIDLGDRQIPFDHVQGGMSKDPLQGIDISAVTEVVNGKCMSETVESWVLNPCASSEAIDRFQ